MELHVETCWKKSERVLVFEESGCSRTATAVMAYLIKKNKLTLKVSDQTHDRLKGGHTLLFLL